MRRSHAAIQLMRHMLSLRHDKEVILQQIEREEEYLTNTLSRKLTQTRQEHDEERRRLEEAHREQLDEAKRKVLAAEHEVRCVGVPPALDRAPLTRGGQGRAGPGRAGGHCAG